MKKRIEGVKGTIQQTITIDNPGKYPIENMTYQWMRNGRPIKGATQASYTTVDEDYNDSGSLKKITCKVTGDVDVSSDVKSLKDVVTVVVKAN